MKHQYDEATQMLQILVPGDLLSTNADRFRTEVLAMIEAQSRDGSGWLGADVDLTAAQMVDSAGLNSIVSLIRKLKSGGKRVMIRVKDPHVHRVFLFTRLDLQADIVRT